MKPERAAVQRRIEEHYLSRSPNRLLEIAAVTRYEKSIENSKMFFSDGELKMQSLAQGLWVYFRIHCLKVFAGFLAHSALLCLPCLTAPAPPAATQ